MSSNVPTPAKTKMAVHLDDQRSAPVRASYPATIGRKRNWSRVAVGAFEYWIAARYET